MHIEITRETPPHSEDALHLLREYLDSVQVVKRGDTNVVGLWLARADGEAAGCIVLRTLQPGAGEVKRLYVRPQFRKHGLAEKLLSALENDAASLGMMHLYLDTKDDLTAAIRFYERSGYTRCERYNDNPQATIFMKKPLLQIREFQPGDEESFWSLNEAWISKLFTLEEKDIAVLRNPRDYVLASGGRIYMACRGDERVGCCALLNMGSGSYELGKMGVAETERRKGVGRALLEFVVAEARRLGIPRLFLETNHILENAIHLYETVGFKRIEPLERSPYKRCDVSMELLLP